jgi:hypothetical protein
MTPLPDAEGLTVPEIVPVDTALAVKLTPVASAPLIVTVRLPGVNVNPVFEGVTV